MTKGQPAVHECSLPLEEKASGQVRVQHQLFLQIEKESVCHFKIETTQLTKISCPTKSASLVVNWFCSVLSCHKCHHRTTNRRWRKIRAKRQISAALTTHPQSKDDFLSLSVMFHQSQDASSDDLSTFPRACKLSMVRNSSFTVTVLH